MPPFLDHQGLGDFALGEAAASHEPAVAPHSDHHGFAALRADFVCRLVSYLDPRYLRGCPLQCLFQGVVEFLNYCCPVLFALSYLIQPLLHLGGEFYVDDLGEMLHQQAVDRCAQLQGIKSPFFSLYIASLSNYGDDRGIGAGAPDTPFLQRFYQGSLIIAGWGLSEVLLRQNAQKLESFALG